MKRRALPLLLAAVMVLTLLSGCGKAEEQPKTGNSTVTTTTTTAADTTTTTDTTADTTATDSTTSTTTAPSATESTTVPSKTTKAPTKSSTTKTTTTTTVIITTLPKVAAKLGGVSLSEYAIVYSYDSLDYVQRAVGYIHDQILARTGADLAVVTDAEAPIKHEIVVGETNRSISKTLNAKTEGLEFSLTAKDGSVALEADYFIIAAAAYYFVETYITGKNASTTVPDKVQVLEPIKKTPKNFIFLIGDGMGLNHVELPTVYDTERMDVGDGTTVSNFTDGEKIFYGKLFPSSGTVQTFEVGGGITDSAAAATALATGYKTSNGRIGKDKDKNDLKSITEIAGDLGMATAVMTTEGQTGATPGGFSAHADARDMYDDITADQEAMTEKYGTVIKDRFDNYNALGMWSLEWAINGVLDQVSRNKKGFFMMYEEAYIDKHSHNQDEEKATWAVYRFNQAIGVFMEFAFYNPETFVLITADHETGNLTKLGKDYVCAHGDHTGKLVPVFAYGVGAEVFDGQTIENVQIPKTIAKMWGQSLAADTDNVWPALN